MLKIAICDDEEVVCAMLKEMVLGHLGELGEACDIKCYANGSQLLQGPFCSDILLLDIQMPGVDGLALAKKLRAEEINCALIFITALAGHVYDAFEVEPIDYLCKPVEAERLKKALNRALRKIEVNDQNYLLVKTMNWCKQIKLSSIYYGEVINRKIYLYTQNGAIDYYGKLEELEKQLDYRFVRCHRSYLVNLDHLNEYANGEIKLTNKTCVPVSRLRYQEVLAAMMEYMKKKED